MECAGRLSCLGCLAQEDSIPAGRIPDLIAWLHLAQSQGQRSDTGLCVETAVAEALGMLHVNTLPD